MGAAMVLHEKVATMKYDNFMIALMDSAQSSDYWPVDLLPMPYTQAALWDAFDNRPVTLRYSTGTPPAGHTEHVRLPARKQHEVDGTHLEEFYVYGPGKGQAGTSVWFRCGYGAPTWLVLDR
jgi:hypothetical protein